jgi:hypothetical protein
MLKNRNLIDCELYFSVTRISQNFFFVALVINVIDQIMNGWWITKYVLYFIQYVTLNYNYIE